MEKNKNKNWYCILLLSRVLHCFPVTLEFLGHLNCIWIESTSYWTKQSLKRLLRCILTNQRQKYVVSSNQVSDQNQLWFGFCDFSPPFVQVMWFCFETWLVHFAIHLCTARLTKCKLCLWYKLIEVSYCKTLWNADLNLLVLFYFAGTGSWSRTVFLVSLWTSFQESQGLWIIVRFFSLFHWSLNLFQVRYLSSSQYSFGK